MGRQSVSLRCDEMGHHRATCPLKTAPVKSYTAATKGNQDDEGGSRVWLG